MLAGFLKPVIAHLKDSKASRYIMYSLLVQNYLIRAKTNVTLQTLNSAIVADFNKLSQEGLQVGDEVLGI